MAMKKTKAHITVTSILTVLSPLAECVWDDSRKWQKISQLYEDEIAESLAKIIIARKCVTKKTQRICAKGSKNKHEGKNVIRGYKLIFYRNY